MLGPLCLLYSGLALIEVVVGYVIYRAAVRKDRQSREELRRLLKQHLMESDPEMKKALDGVNSTEYPHLARFLTEVYEEPDENTKA